MRSCSDGYGYHTSINNHHQTTSVSQESAEVGNARRRPPTTPPRSRNQKIQAPAKTIEAGRADLRHQPLRQDQPLSRAAGRRLQLNTFLCLPSFGENLKDGFLLPETDTCTAIPHVAYYLSSTPPALKNCAYYSPDLDLCGNDHNPAVIMEDEIQ